MLPGTYRIEITAPGFKRYIQQNVVVSAATTVRTDIQLTLGQVSEQVEVTAATAVIQTENAKVSTQVQNKLVDELPLIVAGSGGGYFRTGRHINCNLLSSHPSGLKYRSRTSTHNLYTSFLNAFGFPDTHFGNGQVEFRGPLPGMT